MLMLKEMQSTAPVEIAVEISRRMWKSQRPPEFSTFPQGTISLALWKCGKLELKLSVQRA
jgi:hypothetical protein